MKETSNQEEESSQEKYIYETIGGPTRFYNKRKKLNPLYLRKNSSKSPKISDEWYQAFVLELIKARYQQKLSQKVLAHELKTHQSVISKFEQGKTNPTLIFIQNYAHAIGKNINISLTA